MTDLQKNPLPSPWQTASQRRSERELKREAVLRAAVQLFNERGFNATSLDDVAARLGVSKPVIYHHVGNKDQVLFHCLRHGVEQLREAAELSRDRSDSSQGRLELFLRRYAEVIMSDFGRCVITTDDRDLSPESRRQFRALKREIDLAMRQALNDAERDGFIWFEDVRLAAFAISGALNWTAHWQDPNGARSVQDIAEVMTRMLLDGLAPRTRSPCTIVDEAVVIPAPTGVSAREADTGASSNRKR